MVEWTPRVVKWKTKQQESIACSDGRCVTLQKFDTMAAVTVFEIVGFKQRCTGHTDGLAFPEDRVLGFDGQWRTYDDHMAWESAWYSYVVWHEILDREAAGTFASADVPKAQANQMIRAGLIAAKAGLPQLARADTDDGPWKPNAQAEPSAAARDGLTRAYGWFMRDDGLMGRMQALTKIEAPDLDPLWWFEGVGDLRILHVDTTGQLTTQQKRRVEDAAELQFGLGRLIWEG